MNEQIRRRLDQIAGLLDENHIKKAEELQEKVWAFEPVDQIPTIISDFIPSDHKLYPYYETFTDMDKMFWNELALTYAGTVLKDHRMFTLRANYGPAIVPSIFGSDFIVDKNTTWVNGFHSSIKIKDLINRGIPDINTGLCSRSFETQAFFKNYLTESGLEKLMHIVQTDTQGPFDIAEMIWGAEIYYAMCDEPDLVHEFMSLITETIILYIKQLKINTNEPLSDIYHWWYKVPAAVRIVDDVSTNLSPEMYSEFVKPYNEKVFNAFGSGYMHYCGHGLQSHELRLDTKGLKGIEMAGGNVAQNTWEYNLKSIWEQAFKKKVTICWLIPGLPETRPELNTGLIYLNSVTNAVNPPENVPEYYKKVRDFWSF